MARLKVALLRLLLVIACCVLLAALPSMAQAQTTPPESSPEPVVPATPAQSSVDAPPAATATPQESENNPNDLTPPKAGRTYQQPPNPYDMEAMEAYDQEVYGEGR